VAVPADGDVSGSVPECRRLEPEHLRRASDNSVTAGIDSPSGRVLVVSGTGSRSEKYIRLV
jgi:hypothetical protein